MKKVANFFRKYARVLAAFALTLGVASVNSACYLIYHQPKVPEAMNAYKK